MEAATLTVDQTWCWLWSYSAHQIITRINSGADIELIDIGYGWGLRRADDPRRAILLYPSRSGQSTGDLALAFPGMATQVIPRCGASYTDYVDDVATTVEAVARAFLED